MREFDHTELTAYPMDLFDRNMTDGRMMMVSCLTLVIGHNHAMGDIKRAKIHGLLHA